MSIEGPLVLLQVDSTIVPRIYGSRKSTSVTKYTKSLSGSLETTRTGMVRTPDLVTFEKLV